MKKSFNQEQSKVYSSYVKTRYLDAIDALDQWDNDRTMKAYTDLCNAFCRYSGEQFKKLLAMALNEAGLMLKKYKAKVKGFCSGTKGMIISGVHASGKVVTFCVASIPSIMRHEDIKTFCCIRYGIVSNLSVTHIL